MSKEEVQEYGTQKTNFMYSKYGSVRMFSMVLFVGIIAGVVMYKQKNMLKSMKGSLLEEEVKMKVANNKKMSALLSSKG